MPTFSERLKELRKLNKLSQRALAEKTNLSERGIQDCEYGKHPPSSVTLIKLADYFNVSVDYLLGRTDFKEVSKGMACGGAYPRDEKLKKMIEEMQTNNIEENEKLKKLMEEFQKVAKKEEEKDAPQLGSI